MERYLKVPQFAVALNLSPKTVWNWIAQRKLAIVRVGRSVRVPATELDRLIEEGTVPTRES
jgi:excisionase family DNA binding protein